MKNQVLFYRKIISSISLCFLFVITSCNSTSLVAQNNEAEKDKIENTVTQLYAAMVEKDKSVLQELTMEKLTYGHSSGTIENQSEYVDGVLNGAFQFSSISPEDQNIEISGNTGIVRHIFKGEGTNSGTPARVNIGCIMVFQKQGRDWKLLARQAYKL